MNRLREKLHNERGASILLALLIFLACMMVASSVLAAASSNAGKVRSNRVEQQKYLALSSAIRLVADEIQKAEYKGKYQVRTWGETQSDGSTKSFYYFEQMSGEYKCGYLTNQLPLGKELNEIFGQKFTGEGYKKLGSGDVEDATPRILVVKLPDGLAGYPNAGAEVYKIQQEVTVQVELNHGTKHIKLMAWLGTDKNKKEDLDKTDEALTAELVLQSDVLTVDENNAPPGYIRKSSPPGTTAKYGEYETTPISWKLNWISK